MQVTDLGSLLSYGAIGLGLALAILAFSLLRAEQKVKEPRISILASVYVFMGFSLLLSSAGFITEFLRSQETTKLTVSREVLDALMDVKGGKISRLKQLDPSDPSYYVLVTEIQRDLEIIDNNIRGVLAR